MRIIINTASSTMMTQWTCCHLSNHGVHSLPGRRAPRQRTGRWLPSQQLLTARWAAQRFDRANAPPCWHSPSTARRVSPSEVIFSTLARFVFSYCTKSIQRQIVLSHGVFKQAVQKANHRCDELFKRETCFELVERQIRITPFQKQKQKNRQNSSTKT